VHQFSLIGEHAMIGGGFRITQDVPPYAIVGGYPARVLTINKIGLERRGFTPAEVKDLSRAFRILYRSGLNLTQAMERLIAEGPQAPHVKRLIEFYGQSERGVMR
jgi:UDP-N-acetylglucosamine acyltransferase